MNERACDKIACRQIAALTLPTGRSAAILALVVANVVWGTTFVATKPMLERVPPLTLATARFAIALLVLLPILALNGSRPRLGRTPALMGFTGVFLVYLGQNVGLEFTSAADGALIHGGIPVMTMLLAAPLLCERLTARGLAGCFVSMLGVGAVVLRGTETVVGRSAFGNALLVLSALALASYLVIGRRAFPGGGSLELVAGVACYGLLFLLPASGIELAARGIARPTNGDLLGLLYLGAAASALAFVLWGYGLRHLEAGQAAVFANLNPLIGVAAAGLLLGEPVTLAQIGGGVVILGGLWLATTTGVRRASSRVERARSLSATGASQAYVIGRSDGFVETVKPG